MAARTSVTATSNATVQYLIGNQQGTATLAIDDTTLAVTRRYYDPYGNPVGAAPPAWPGTRGFVGGTADPVTGLTNLGAREYQPGTGAFVSPDALVNPYDPQDLNAYAADNPSTESDPSGLLMIDTGNCIGSIQFCVAHSGGGGGGGGGSHHSTASGGGGGEPICYYCYDSRTTGGYSGGRTDPSSQTCQVVSARFTPGMECHPTPSGGGFGWLRKFGHWVAHTAVPWVTRNRTALGWGEVALGIVSMIPGIGAAADVAFFIGMGLSAATTADECATRNGQGCAFGVTSMVFGGMGVGLNRVSDNLARAAERAKFFKSVALEVAADMTKVGSYATNGFSVASSVVSDLP